MKKYEIQHYCDNIIKIACRENLPSKYFFADLNSPASSSNTLDEKQLKYFNELKSIPGITLLSFKPYEISIHKAPLFDWSEIMPIIETLTEEYFGYQYGQLPIWQQILLEIYRVANIWNHS